jgi:hypothetical protein
MAKVEGSNPFIRFAQSPRKSGGFVVRGWPHVFPDSVGTLGAPLCDGRLCLSVAERFACHDSERRVLPHAKAESLVEPDRACVCAHDVQE